MRGRPNLVSRRAPRASWGTGLPQPKNRFGRERPEREAGWHRSPAKGPTQVRLETTGADGSGFHPAPFFWATQKRVRGWSVHQEESPLTGSPLKNQARGGDFLGCSGASTTPPAPFLTCGKNMVHPPRLKSGRPDSNRRRPAWEDGN
jgi:hypothetical protein